MNSWLSNISVNLKLALGFGLVLALTCVMAISDGLSLGKLIDRSNWMSDIHPAQWRADQPARWHACNTC